MKFKKLIDIMFDMVTYINGVLATYEDKMWLRINIMVKEDFLSKAKIVNDKLYIETV